MDRENQPAADHLPDYRSLYEEAPLAYQSLGRRGEILLVNGEWLRLLGCSGTEAIGRSFADFLTAGSQELLEQRLAALETQGLLRNQVCTLVHRSGREIPVRIDARAVTAGTGEFLRSHCIVREMSTELAAEKARDMSEGRYRRLVELAREGIWEIDADAHTVFVNPAMAAMLEYTEQEMIGRHLFDFMDERGRRISERNLKRREDGIEEQHDFEFIAKSGRRILTTIETCPLFDADGNYSGALAGMIDVTERRRFDQEMMHTQKLESLGMLAGGIAHDFNNLLQTIIGNATLAQADLGQEVPAHDSLREIRQAADRASDLCQQMLAYAGRSHFQIGRIDLAELVREMSEILKVSLPKKAHLEVDLDPDLPPVEADSSQLGQVVMNLITNAAEALADGDGTVRAVVRKEHLDREAIDRRFALGPLQEGPHVVLTVVDTGCGMDAETVEKIFDPFFTTKFAGRGLGLAAVLGIVQGHGGAIAVASVPGEGTTVAVALPAFSGGYRRSESTPEPAGEKSRRSLRILVAEDELSVQRAVCRTLKRLGHDVEAVANGREAVEAYRLQSARYDLVILDLSMPVLDGREAMKEIRDADREVPIVISSGFPAEDIAAGFGTDQPNCFLKKPFDAERLKECLNRSLA